MKDIIREKYNSLVEDIRTSYNKIKIVDNFDWNEYSPYTIFYLSKNASFDKFSALWKKIVEESREKDYTYDDILWLFEYTASYDFDFIALGTLDIYTDSEYQLEI